MKKVFYSAIALSLLAGSATYAQNVGIGTATPASKLTVNGNASIGNGFGSIAAPANGAIVQGSLGIGTSAPAAKLDVTGNVKIVDGTQSLGRVLTSDANGLASWQPGLLDPTAAGFDAPYAEARGGANLTYGNGDWGNNAVNTIQLNESADPNNVYDPATGIFTITENGQYSIVSVIRLRNNPAAGAVFDGVSGLFVGRLNIKPSTAPDFVTVAGESKTVLRGVKVPFGATTVDAYMTGSFFLKAGDQIRATFATYGTGNMNSDNAQIIIERGNSIIRLYKF